MKHLVPLTAHFVRPGRTAAVCRKTGPELQVVDHIQAGTCWACQRQMVDGERFRVAVFVPVA